MAFRLPHLPKLTPRAVAPAALLLAALLLPAPADAGDADLLAALRVHLPRAETAGAAARAGAGGPDAVQAQYDAARDLEEALRAAMPASASCRPVLRTALAFARGHVMQAEGFDRPAAWLMRSGTRKARRAQARLEAARAKCRPVPVEAPSSQARELGSPRSGEAFFGSVSVRVPAGTAAVELLLNNSFVAVATPVAGRATFEITRPPGRYDVRVRFRAGPRVLGYAESRRVWLLLASARRAVRPGLLDGDLSDELTSLAQGFSGYSGMWVRDLTTGRTARWNSDARFPAASTVKLAVLVEGLRRFGPRPERSPVAYDLTALATWSSNLATNRLLVEIGGSQVAGASIAQEALDRLGAASSTFTGGYRVGTAVSGVEDAPSPPPLVSSRVTTARDLGRILFQLHAAAVGDRRALAKIGLTLHQARVGLAVLLSSQAVGDNVGLFRPALGPTFPMAQKHGWLSSARHSAALLYGAEGPIIVVLLSYRPGLTRAEAVSLGRALVSIIGATSAPPRIRRETR